MFDDRAVVTESQIISLQVGRSCGAGRALCCENAHVRDAALGHGAQKTHHLACGYMTGYQRYQGHDNERRADCLLQHPCRD